MAQFTSDVFVYDAVRTPKGRVRRHGGSLAGVPAHELLAQLLVALERRGLPTDTVDDVVIGTSTAVGEQGGNIARAAASWAAWPDAVPGGTVSRLCCSGLAAIENAAAMVASGVAEVVVAGGVESMSRVPMLSDRPAFAADETLGERTGFVTIGVSADLTAAEYGITRADLDGYAVTSHRRAVAAPSTTSIVPVVSDSVVILDEDEGARADVDLATLEAMAALFGDDPSWARVARRMPGFQGPVGGLHTLATAPALADGAAAATIGSATAAARLGQQAVAQIVGVAQAAVRSPLLNATAVASRRALENAGIDADHLDVVEANESFAVSPLLMTREFELDPERVNPTGGALATGHPLGASGGILLVNALDHLARTDGEHALICIPAALGLGAALVVRRLR